MRYLCKMATPPDGLILDPFTGSGSTGKGAVLDDFSFVGIEQDAEYFEIAKARINFSLRQKEEGNGLEAKRLQIDWIEEKEERS